MDYREEYVRINGIEQYLLHCPAQGEAPVLLYLHGGPGGTEAPFAFEMGRYWGNLFHVVHWDQRGTGKTLLHNPASVPTTELLLEDLGALTERLAAAYGTKKIVLLGHSWGSVLGIQFVRRSPERVAAFIGTGQVVDAMENERAGYEKLREAILRSGSRAGLARLARIGEYPVADAEEMMRRLMRVRQLQERYGTVVSAGRGEYGALLRSPVFHLADLWAMLAGMRANREVVRQLLAFRLDPRDAVYRIPLYFILGGQDFVTPPEPALAYLRAARAPEKRAFRIEGAGHNAMLERPRAFTGCLREIRRRVGTL